MAPALIFTAAAVVMAAAWYGLLGVAGAVAYLAYLAPVVVGGYLYSLYWHARRRLIVPFGRTSVQANRDLVRGTPGLVYFGALLGNGLLTEMSSPLVWAGAGFAAVAGPLPALLYGVGFGLGRSATALAGIPLGPRVTDYGRVADFVTGALRRRLHPVGVVAALLGAAVVAVGFLATMGVLG